MAIFNFKNKTEKEEKTAPKKTEVKNAVQEKIVAQKPARTSGKKSNKGYAVLENPHITEKATDLVGKNQYVFKVKNSTNKTEVKKAIEGIYGVNVLRVNIVNIHPRKRRLGRTMGMIPGCKKAIIKIKEGQKIEVLQK